MNEHFEKTLKEKLKEDVKRRYPELFEKENFYDCNIRIFQQNKIWHGEATFMFWYNDKNDNNERKIKEHTALYEYREPANGKPTWYMRRDWND